MNPIVAIANTGIVEKTTHITTYQEKKEGRTLYRITSIYKGEIDFATTLEDLVVKKILSEENTAHVLL